ncbi:GNAT family N-acetyltransferase [Steroidobacter cummioxidans]|uniref:GNAT family N-acetyltransferase n=1 Tax=Steroidobacter cummioxidans TaxID=1803913 RepID=UPI000E30E24F|nr:GNAT family N-acetyltransferase [Steroidobacter cummioxidans]
MTLARDTQRIESERLTLRRIEPDDFEFFAHVHADPEVARYLSHGKPRSAQESHVWLQSVLRTYEDFSLGQLAVLRKLDGMLIGRCGLSDLAVEVRASATAVPRGWYQRDDAPADVQIVFERELGYTFHRNSWGQGYASEAARCVFDYARDVLRLPRVISLIHPDNSRSLRVAQRFGAQREDVVEVMSRPFDRFAWPISP